MDGKLFDALARSLSGAPSRRRFVHALGGALAAVGLGAEGEAAKRCKKIFQKCRRSNECCQRTRKAVCELNPQIGPGRMCCIPEGATCGFGGQCCNSLTCVTQPDGTGRCGVL